MATSTFTTVVFDLGGVLIDWNPRYLYRRIFADEAEMEAFLATVCTPAWNDEQDAGRPLAEATALLVGQHPQHAAAIRAYYDRLGEMFSGPIAGSVAVLEELRQAGRHRLYALTNWSHETFPYAQRTFDFLAWFEGIVVSGTEQTRKPYPAIYHTLLRRYALDPVQTLFIDDNATNIRAAEALGLTGIHFHSPEQLRAALVGHRVLV
ncbi:HAD family hydrolase [uncultured Hymenobacter sp.]|uniref:HAD family hydrolase n=1 Tax=uncultured Hymenobacter sp. TaxID=170016 RepID=UPI0035CBECE5